MLNLPQTQQPAWLDGLDVRHAFAAARLPVVVKLCPALQAATPAPVTGLGRRTMKGMPK
jgi:hypothetical protein